VTVAAAWAAELPARARKMDVAAATMPRRRRA
jgi:hypothetical protein